MSQSTLDPNAATPATSTTSENATGDQTSAARSATPTRRRRHSATRTKATAQRAETAGVSGDTATEPQQQAAPAEAAPASPEPAAQASASAGEPAEAASQPRSRARARNTTRNTRSRSGAARKNEVQLVIPPSASDETAAPTPEVAEIVAEPAPTPAAETQSPAAEVRLVPVTTSAAPAEPATAAATADGATAALAASAPTEPATATSEEASQPPRRYRFDRRPAQTIPGSAVRPERLSSSPAASAATPIVGDTASVRIEPTTSAAESTPAAASPAPDETRAAPASLFPGAFAREERTESPSRDAIDDIVSALGLRGAAPARPAQPAEAPTTTTTPEQATTATPEPVGTDERIEAADKDQESAENAESADGEGQQSTRRRPRRRRRSNGASARASETAEDESEEAEPTTEPWTAGADTSPTSPTSPRANEAPAAPITPLAPTMEREGRNGYDPYNPYESLYTEQPPYSPYNRAARPQTQRERDRLPREQSQPEWDIANAQEQLRQSESPFAAPEPSFARGFGPQPSGVAGPVRETYSRPTRGERGVDTPPISPNQLAATITNAIQQQTDRLLSVLRQQTPPSMTVTLPALPSMERVGVFVDVANLLYSSRSLRVSIDFGRLLDFLRGNRRLIRAHAYAPTNPDPHAEQAFLSAVKGLGYRITTKNYKTFSSGAKKADMDLDLCMDIVRMVDAEAIDTVVLVSGDSDFLPLLEYCSDHGVRVEVAAFDDSAAMILRQSCDLFINLSLVDDIRA